MSFAKIREIIANHIGVEAEKIQLNSEFKKDLNIDSLDIFEIIMELEDEYAIEIPTEDLEEMSKVSDLVAYIDKLKE